MSDEFVEEIDDEFDEENYKWVRADEYYELKKLGLIGDEE